MFFFPVGMGILEDTPPGVEFWNFPIFFSFFLGTPDFPSNANVKGYLKRCHFPDDTLLVSKKNQAAAKATVRQGSTSVKVFRKNREGSDCAKKGEHSFWFHPQLSLMYPSPLFSVNISSRAPSYKEKCRCPFQFVFGVSVLWDVWEKSTACDFDTVGDSTGGFVFLTFSYSKNIGFEGSWDQGSKVLCAQKCSSHQWFCLGCWIWSW